mmetsp:Transcript_8165/g.16296  ORF Transcript_8165/g.16296 Transcript_8165/m.16296 type:complete len:212 (+) Transcript_8165:532-1167(+)
MSVARCKMQGRALVLRLCIYVSLARQQHFHNYTLPFTGSMVQWRAVIVSLGARISLRCEEHLHCSSVPSTCCHVQCCQARSSRRDGISLHRLQHAVLRPGQLLALRVEICLPLRKRLHRFAAAIQCSSMQCSVPSRIRSFHITTPRHQRHHVVNSVVERCSVQLRRSVSFDCTQLLLCNLSITFCCRPRDHYGFQQIDLVRSFPMDAAGLS